MRSVHNLSNVKLLGVVFVAAFAVNLVVGLKFGIAKPMASDAEHYLDIATSLAAGHGFTLPHGFWPQAPTMSRSPAWPFTVSLALRLFPHASPDTVMRCLVLALNALVAALVGALTLRLFERRSAAILAAAAYAVHPTPLFLACQGASEMIFLLCGLAGTLLVLGKGWRPYAGMVVLGCAALSRPNFVLWIGFAGALWLIAALRARCRADVPIRPAGRAMAWRGALAALLFLLPSLFWAARNYTVCGDFPVLSTLRGQTLYGGNNPMVADTLEWWGYWVFPDLLPGETRMEDLSHTKSEYEVDCYYYARGRDYIRQHAFAMPRLVLGKLVRSYVPMPWKPAWGTYAIAVVRLMLFALAAAGAVMAWRSTASPFKIVLGAMILTNVVTVSVFWGCARFAFAWEPFLLPWAALAVCQVCAPRCRRAIQG